MLTRNNYYDRVKKEIERIVLNMVDDLDTLMDRCVEYLGAPSRENKSFLLAAEDEIDQEEKEIEDYILNFISVQTLSITDIKWLFTMHRIIRELERTGDQITNVMTICNAKDEEEAKRTVEQFFELERAMVAGLKRGIESKEIATLENVMSQDAKVNELNRETYQTMTHLMNDNKINAEFGSKLIIVSRFLERFGDHIVNAAKLYKKYIIFERDHERIT
ncbi:phosphate uptake regulator PhoU [Camelliibacillus cellulosilyticus]|uniref:Phosphate uptake regulator PhoU n=1 Tax=Camelliibacillus cellulosilyticus TaxID=2174486 RepID=A0ABV9GKR9_9BACL